MRPALRRTWILAVFLLPLSGLLYPGPLWAQSGSVLGTILHAETGEPLEAVHISLTPAGQEDPTFTALTRPDGQYLLVNVPAGSYLVQAELIGFAVRTGEVDVVGGLPTRVDFRLEPEPISLSEIVVTGVIGSTQRTKLPFDVVQVRAADLPVPGVNAAQSLVGKVPGAQVVQEGGIPGAMPSILLRGPTSIDAGYRNQDPLYVVDEAIVGADLVDLSSLDIQSIEVIKGAAAASLYGSRAGNGVVHIRTKRGAELPDARIRYILRSEAGGSVLGRDADRLVARSHPYAMTPDGSRFIGLDGQPCDWLECAGQPALAGQAAGDAPATEWNTFQSNPWPGRTYDQVARFFTHGTYLQNQLAVEGRMGGTNFRISGSRLDQSGIVRYLPAFSRSDFRLNLDQALSEDLSLRTSLFYSRSTRPHPGLEWDAISRLMWVAPIVDLMARDSLNPDWPLYFVGPEQQVNPLYNLELAEESDDRSRFLGTLTARYDPLAWLGVEGNFSFDHGDLNERLYWPKGYHSMVVEGRWNEGHLANTRTTAEALNASLTASARWDLGEEIRGQTQARYLLESQDRENVLVDGIAFAVADVPALTNIDQSTLLAQSGTETIRADGFFLITNLDLYDRYVVDALVRNDGSSLFGEDQRRQWYWRLGGAWRLGQEPFFRLDWVDDLKLRYSVGTAGGRPIFDAQYETLTVQEGRVVPSRLGNRDLRPEHSTEHEAGIDISLFDYRTVLSLTHARTTTTDQILNVPVATYTGFISQWQNAGTMASRTWEATLDVRLVDRPALSWDARFLFDATRAEITELNRTPFKTGFLNMFYVREGEEIGTFFATVPAESCDHLPDDVSCDAFDINDDGYLVWVGENGSLDDPEWGLVGPEVGGKDLMWGTPFPALCTDRVTGERTPYCQLGNALPDYNLGLSTKVTWKGLSFYALLTRTAGFEIRRAGMYYPALFDQQDVPEAERKPIGYYEANLSNNVTAHTEDGTFTKLRELSLAYRFGPDILRRVPGLRQVSGLTVRLSGQNLHTWSGYSGFDPDVGGEGGATGSAVIERLDYFAYPNMRTITGSVEVVF